MNNYNPSKDVADGEPDELTKVNMELFTCCDCALTHLLVHEIDEDMRITTYSYRDEYRTKVERKRLGISGIRHRKKGK